MSFLSKLLGLDSEKPKPEEFQNRAHRVNLLPLHNLKFVPVEPPFKDFARVSNISLTGISLLKQDGRGFPVSDQVFSGKLSIEGVEVPVTLTAKHDTKERLGCEFVSPDKLLLNFLKSYFEVELAVFDLNFSQKILEGGLEENHLTGSDKCEIYWQNSLPATGPLKIFRFSFFGSYIEGGTGQKVRYGSWISDSIPLTKEPGEISSRIAFEPILPGNVREQIEKIISYTPSLTKDEKIFLKTQIKKL